MRGKNIILLTMAVMLISVGFFNVGFTQEETAVIAATPETIRGMPGDIFDLDITISNVIDCRAWGFVLDFAPYTSVLNIIAVTEGDFLSEGGTVETWMEHSVNTFNGELIIGCTRFPPENWEYPPYDDRTGGYVSGSGLLVTVTFEVVEAGVSTLNIEDTYLYTGWIGSIAEPLTPIPHTIVNSEYIGPLATIKHPAGRITKPTWKVGDTAEFKIRAKNTADVPLYVKARFTFQREDGEACYIWTGQSYTGFGPNVIDVAYVDGWAPFLNQWTAAGPPEFMIGTPDGNYIQSNNNCEFIGAYTFGDIDTKGRIVENVEFYAYSKSQFTGPDIDSMINWMGGFQLAWGNSQGGTLDWAWTNKKYYWPAYNFPEYYGFPLNQPDVQEAINTAEMFLHNYEGGWQQVDAYKMEVTYSKYTPAQGDEASYLVMPGQTIDLSPALWFLSSYDTGYYEGSVTLHFSYGNEWFVRSHNPPAFHFDFTVEP